MPNQVITGPGLEDREHLTTADLVNRPEKESTIEHPSEAEEQRTALFSTDEADRYRSQWHDIQGGFVDEPRHSVERADELVASVIKRLAEVFADERDKLERNWSAGADVSTEDFRQALRRYRSFFDRLLSV